MGALPVGRFGRAAGGTKLFGPSGVSPRGLSAQKSTLTAHFGRIAEYEIALAIARYVIVARDGKQALKWSREDYENAELDKL